MEEPYAAKEMYADLAHQARLSFLDLLRSYGCTCHPHLAVAVVKKPWLDPNEEQGWRDELVPMVKFLAHEPHCWFFMYGREN